MTVTIERTLKDGSDVRITLRRMSPRLRPGWREQGSSRWEYKGEEKCLVKRWVGEFGKTRIEVQRRPKMTRDEVGAWVSPSHLVNSRRFH